MGCWVREVPSCLRPPAAHRFLMAKKKRPAKRSCHPARQLAPMPSDARWPSWDTWTPSDALAGKLALADYLRTEDGAKLLAVSIPEDLDESKQQYWSDVYLAEAASIGDDIAARDVFWLSPDSAKLVEVIAKELMDGFMGRTVRLSEFAFVAPKGLLVISDGKADTDYPKIVLWAISQGQLHADVVLHRPETAGKRTVEHDILGRGFEMQTFLPLPLDTDIPVQSDDAPWKSMYPWMWLLGLGVLQRSRYVEHDDAPQLDPATTSKARRAGASTTVRTSSLLRREVIELEAGRGSKHRAHWVRGHWRRQWHPSVKLHRMKWVEGHMRGDPHLGVLEDRPVLVA